MEITRAITGWIFILIGAFLIGLFLFFPVSWPGLIYGVPLLIFGILILFNVGREEKIEKVKSKQLKTYSSKK